MSAEEYNRSVEHHADGVYRFAVKHLRDTDTAKDVVQESFTRLWTKVDQVDAKKAKSYLFTTAHHIIVDTVRKNQHNTALRQEHEARGYAHQAPHDLEAILRSGLAQLPAIQRSVVLLRDLEGYSYEEIAEMTDLNLSQVKVYIYRGRTQLKDYIGKLETVL
jgi:RNA polymerase sigma factor (sigma-70 family)